MLFRQFPHFIQKDVMDCGPTCLKIIAYFYGKKMDINYLRDVSGTNRMGSTIGGLRNAAIKIGFESDAIKISFQDLITEDLVPCIIYWQQKHFVVLYKITSKYMYISDPAAGLIRYKHEEFKRYFSDEGEGILLLLEPNENFKDLTEGLETKSSVSFDHVFDTLFQYKKTIFVLILALVLTSLMQMTLPFINQKIIDIGIIGKSFSFIYLMLLGQIFLFFGKTLIEVIRTRVLIHLSTRVNLNLISTFFYKLTKLPLKFFDSKLAGDILQRILDHQRVDSFITSGLLNIVFTLLAFFIFGGVLFYYNPIIFLIFLVGSVLHFSWISLFIKKRALIDYKRFNQLSTNQDKNIELIYGMQEIKLHNAENCKISQWQKLQVELFKINLNSIELKQHQITGAALINELKNIFITFMAARLVLNQELTLGIMLSISFIIGQLNGAVVQIVEFIQSYQEAKMSMDRINDIHHYEDESQLESDNVNIVKANDIILKDVSFSYDGKKNVLNRINLTIPSNKITAIVGTSGSGKTTLLKLLLKFYKPTSGTIVIEDIDINSISNHSWRKICGTVMQEGFIFTDTIRNNIVVHEAEIDYQRLENAVKIANIYDFIYSLPMGYETILGTNGIGISTGQKQRILIARAVYKNPDYLFFDEATSALDANNEKKITENLDHYFEGKTVLVIAHRLSTVKNADQIIVMKDGYIVETGTHQELTKQKTEYFQLVKNQLELGA